MPSAAAMDKTLKHLSGLLDKGEVIAYPTETFYGLGARHDREDALERIYCIKQRPLDKAMPLIIGRTELLPLLTPLIPSAAEKLMATFWPGPLTLIFEAHRSLSSYITAGTNKVAVRIPGQSFALDLARYLDYPITATSANLSNMPPAETAEMVIDYFGSSISAVVDNGKSPGGAPSTIVDLTGEDIRLIRQGVISEEKVFSVVHQ